VQLGRQASGDHVARRRPPSAPKRPSKRVACRPASAYGTSAPSCRDRTAWQIPATCCRLISRVRCHYFQVLDKPTRFRHRDHPNHEYPSRIILQLTAACARPGVGELAR
jgi:hypothetical protein